MIPYRVSVYMGRYPIANYVIIGLCTVVMALEYTIFSKATLDAMLLNGWSLPGLFTNTWMHAGLFHLAGNMLFLWVFGNAVCAKLGNAWYAPFFIVAGLASDTVFNLFSGGKALGASGAINGVVGMFLVLFPCNKVSCFMLVFVRPVTFQLRAFWVVLYFASWDVLGIVMELGSVGYWAHVGGFVFGFAAGWVVVLLGLAELDPYQKSLPEYMGFVKSPSLKSTFDPRPEVKRPRPLRRTETTHKPTERKISDFRAIWEQTPVEIETRCSCGCLFKIPARLRGRTTSCPACGKNLKA